MDLSLLPFSALPSCCHVLDHMSNELLHGEHDTTSYTNLTAVDFGRPEYIYKALL